MGRTIHVATITAIDMTHMPKVNAFAYGYGKHKDKRRKARSTAKVQLMKEISNEI